MYILRDGFVAGIFDGDRSCSESPLVCPDDRDLTSSMVPAGRFDMAAIAAFTTCTNGGLMPQARHGGRGVFAFAVPGSKFDGTGFEKLQIGHTHVAFVSLGGAGDAVARGGGVPYRVGEGGPEYVSRPV